MIVNTIYLQVCNTLLEPGGLQLGITTQGDFLGFYVETMQDFLQKTGLIKTAVSISGGFTANNNTYTFPDSILDLHHVFCNNNWLWPSEQEDVSFATPNWRAQRDAPRQWWKDRVQMKQFVIYPTPNFNGTLTIIGTSGLSNMSPTLSSTVEVIPDTFTAFIKYGILARIFSMDGENKDLGRARMCQFIYDIGVEIGKCIMTEALLEEVQQSLAAMR